MAVNEPVWSFGKVHLFTSSGATVGDGDDVWSFGQNVITHEIVAAAGGDLDISVSDCIDNFDKTGGEP